MSKTYDYLVYIGRFQPFHNGHKHVVDSALKLAKNVICVVGSADEQGTPKNPFPVEVRQKMITEVFKDQPVFVLRQDNIPGDNTAWVKEITNNVLDFALSRWQAGPLRIGLVGHKKDKETSECLELFPHWDYIDIENHLDVHATNIREMLFESIIANKDIFAWSEYVPKEILRIIFEMSPVTLKELADEYQYYTDYRKAWEYSPYPPTFLCADALVFCDSHILLIERGQVPGKGRLALPGGFVNSDENLEQAARRELKEETGLIVDKKDCVETWVEDNPSRSLRGRVVSEINVYTISKDNQDQLPSVIAGDDASFAKWVPIDQFEEMRPYEFFEDHYYVIQTILEDWREDL